MRKREVRGKFTIDLENMTDANEWRKYRSDYSNFKSEDFWDRDSSKKWDILPIFSGFLIVVILIILRDFLSSEVLVWLAAGAVGLMSFYCVVKIHASRVPLRGRLYDRTVVPGWQSCRFFLGDRGVALEGDTFAYLLEWKSIGFASAERTSLGEVIRLHETVGNGGILTIPERFFRLDSGGNISWPDAKAFVGAKTKRILAD